MLYEVNNKIPLYRLKLPLKKHGSYGLYGGSFNPVHEGHHAVAQYALSRLDLDGVIWLVTPCNPFKDKSIYADYAIRLSQVKQSISHPKFIITDLEKHIQMRFSYDTIYFLCKRYPHLKFTFIMGSDSIKHLHRWHFFKQITQKVNFCVIIRDTTRYAVNGFPAIRYFKKNNITYSLILKPFKKISSTQIRNQVL